MILTSIINRPPDAYLWDSGTVNLYLFIFLFTCICSLFVGSHKYASNGGKLFRINGINSFPFWLVFGMLLFFLFFRDVGADLPVYRDIFEEAGRAKSFYVDQEPGYILLNQIGNALGFSSFIFIGLMGFITLFLEFQAVKENASKINVGLAILAIVALYYLQSYNLIRMYLVSAILLYFSKFLFKNELKKYAFVILLCIFIHYSAILVYIPLIFLFFYKRNRRMLIIISTVFFVGAFYFTNFLQSIPIFERYQNYLSAGLATNNIGFMQFFINVPGVLLWILLRKHKVVSDYMDVLIAFSICSLLMGLLSYKILMIGRSLVYYNVVFVICIPFAIKQLKKFSAKISFYSGIGYSLYLFYRFYDYVQSYLLLDGIMPYKFK